MPNIKSAIKKMKQDVMRKKKNNAYLHAVNDVVQKASKGVTTKKEEFISKAYAAIDKASKHNVIHGNKAARLKRRVSKLVSHSA